MHDIYNPFRTMSLTLRHQNYMFSRSCKKIELNESCVKKATDAVTFT